MGILLGYKKTIFVYIYMFVYLLELMLKKINCSTKIIRLFNHGITRILINDHIFSYKIINLLSKLRNYQTPYWLYFICIKFFL